MTMVFKKMFHSENVNENNERYVIDHNFEKYRKQNEHLNEYARIEYARIIYHIEKYINQKEYLNEYFLRVADSAFTDYQLIEMKSLIENGVDINFKKEIYHGAEIALIIAIKRNNIDLIKLLIENKADVNIRDKYGYTPLMIASARGSIEIIEFLLENGANINDSNEHGCTLLHMALRDNKIEIVKLLIEKGADINIKNIWGETALIYPVKNRNFVIFSLLIEKVTDINEKDRSGDTLLSNIIYTAKESNDFNDYIKLLIDKNVNINVKGRHKLTPLMDASRYNNIEIVKLFVENGADINAVSEFGTAIDIAKKFNNKEIHQYLMKNKDLYYRRSYNKI